MYVLCYTDAEGVTRYYSDPDVCDSIETITVAEAHPYPTPEAAQAAMSAGDNHFFNTQDFRIEEIKCMDAGGYFLSHVRPTAYEGDFKVDGPRLQFSKNGEATVRLPIDSLFSSKAEDEAMAHFIAYCIRFTEAHSVTAFSGAGHTPGPWKLCAGAYVSLPNKTAFSLAETGDTVEESEANAAVCASGPDLLIGCIEAEKFLAGFEDAQDDAPECLGVVRSAIKKATSRI